MRIALVVLLVACRHDAPGGSSPSPAVHREAVRSAPVPAPVLPPAEAEADPDPTAELEDVPADEAAVVGQIVDPATGEPVAGAVVIATDGATRHLAAVSDEDGRYRLTGMTAGDVTLDIYYGDTTSEYRVTFAAGTVTVFDHELAPPVISIPVPGRTFDVALGAAAGSQDDSAGYSISSHCGGENVYIVDGADGEGM
jgi:hypothetical protein